MTPLRETSKLRALVVGIDKYESSLDDGPGPLYQDLAGCVKDAMAMEEYLRIDLAVPKENITCLLHEDPRAAPREAPTYTRISEALLELLEESRPGDQVLVHFAGHGGRAPTLFPELKGTGGKDEGLVPADITDPGSQYVRDIELCCWLARMTARGVFVTLILDCCHSGGARRKGRPGIRTSSRANEVEQRVRDRPSLLASREELRRAWRRSTASTPVAKSSASGLDLTSKENFAMLAACSASQAALEYQLPDGSYRGAFTFWLLHILRRRGGRLTFQELHRRVKGQLQQLFWGDQTPQLEGDHERLVFESCYRDSISTIEVLRRQDERALLAAGQVQGLRRGMRLEVYPSAWVGEPSRDLRCAVIETEAVGAVETTARILEEEAKTPLGAGCQVLSPRSFLRNSTLHIAAPLDDSELQELSATIGRGQCLDLASRETDADWKLTFGEDETFRILNADGYLCPNQGAPIRRRSPGALPRIVSRIQHLARFSRIEALENFDPGSQPRNQLRLALHRLPDHFEIGERPALGARLSEDCFLREGQWICLSLENHGEPNVYLTILDLQPLWSIQQIFPHRASGYLLEPNGVLQIPLCASLPRGLTAGRDLLKIFATLESTPLDCLQMPVIGEATRCARPAPLPQQGLGSFLASMVDERLTRRDLTRQCNTTHEWAVLSTSLTIRADGGSRKGTEPKEPALQKPTPHDEVTQPHPFP